MKILTEWYDCLLRDVLFKFQTTEGVAAKTKYGTDLRRVGRLASSESIVGGLTTHAPQPRTEIGVFVFVIHTHVLDVLDVFCK